MAVFRAQDLASIQGRIKALLLEEEEYTRMAKIVGGTPLSGRRSATCTIGTLLYPQTKSMLTHEGGS
jgi:hypothetical protein